MEQHKKKQFITLICIIIGSFISALNIKTFVTTAGLFPGGFSGLTILIQKILSLYWNIDIGYSILNITLNIIPAMIAYKFVGKKFTLYSIVAIVMTALFVDMIPFTMINGDQILLSIFGGIVNGISITILLKGNLSSGGTDFIAMAVSNRLNISTWNYVLIFNAIIIVISGMLLNWEVALYSIVFQFCSTQVINTFYRRYKKVSVFIISEKTEEISDKLITDVHHGVTRFEGIGCYSNSTRNMLYTVVSEEQLRDVIRIIKNIDSLAFVNVVKTEQINGIFHLNPFE